MQDDTPLDGQTKCCCGRLCAPAWKWCPTCGRTLDAEDDDGCAVCGNEIDRDLGDPTVRFEGEEIHIECISDVDVLAAERQPMTDGGTVAIPCGCGEYAVTVPSGDLPETIDVVCPECENHFGHGPASDEECPCRHAHDETTAADGGQELADARSKGGGST